MTLDEATQLCRSAAARAKRLMAKEFPVGTEVTFKGIFKAPVTGRVIGHGFSRRTGEPLLFVSHKLGRGVCPDATTVADVYAVRVTKTGRATA